MDLQNWQNVDSRVSEPSYTDLFKKYNDMKNTRIDRRNLLATAVVGVSFSAALSSHAKDGADHPELEKVRALLKAHDDAMTNHDLPGVLATLADDAVVMGSGPGDLWVGQKDLKMAYEHFFMVYDKGEQEFEYLSRKGGLSSEMGWLVAAGNVTGKLKGKEFAYPLNVSLTVEKKSGDWKMAAMHFSTLTGEQ